MYYCNLVVIIHLMIPITKKADIWGATASSLCIIHCVATPFIFITQACTATCCESTPVWWRFIDYFFLVISFLAIYRSTQTTVVNWIRTALWLSWISLFLVIMNEKIEWISLPEVVNYIPAIALTLLHLYNQKYCQCNQGKCCTNEG